MWADVTEEYMTNESMEESVVKQHKLKWRSSSKFKLWSILFIGLLIIYTRMKTCDYTLFFAVELNKLCTKIDSKSIVSHGSQCKPRVLAEPSTLLPPPNAPEWTLKSRCEPAAIPQQPPTPPATMPAVPAQDNEREDNQINSVINGIDAEDSRIIMVTLIIAFNNTLCIYFRAVHFSK